MLSLIIPAYNEENNIVRTVKVFNEVLKREKIYHEIVVVNDHSTDRTKEVVLNLKEKIKELNLVDNLGERGFGNTVVCGLNNFSGDCVAIVMGDLSDSPEDLVKYYRKLLEGYDCVFGSRFVRGGKVVDYPVHKLVLNRIVNSFIRALFWIRYNDVTNAFKLYSKETIEGLRPFLGRQFNLTVELPLKAIVRGYRYAVVPNSWTNRKEGVSNLKINEMGSRYLFIILYCFLEKLLSKGDYKKSKV